MFIFYLNNLNFLINSLVNNKAVTVQSKIKNNIAPLDECFNFKCIFKKKRKLNAKKRLGQPVSQPANQMNIM